MRGKLALYCLEDKTVLYIDSKENEYTEVSILFNKNDFLNVAK